jgi:hypothetical protein
MEGKSMNEVETVLDKLGLVLPANWAVDAVHLLDTAEDGGRVVVLGYDCSRQTSIIADINPDTGEPDKIQVYTTGDAARLAYVERVAARLFRYYNGKAPALSFEVQNKEDR